MSWSQLMRCGLAVLMLTVGTTADAQGLFARIQANRAARVEARAAARAAHAGVVAAHYRAVAVDGMDCSSGVCVPRTTFRYVATAPTMVPGSYRSTTSYAVVGSGSSHGGTASYLGYSDTAPSSGSDGGGPIYETAQASTPPAAEPESEPACQCDGDCDCPDCPCRQASKAEVDEDEGLSVFGYRPSEPGGGKVFAYRPTDDASPFAYRAAPSTGAIAGL